MRHSLESNAPSIGLLPTVQGSKATMAMCLRVATRREQLAPFSVALVSP
jgi:hypothetical protein